MPATASAAAAHIDAMEDADLSVMCRIFSPVLSANDSPARKRPEPQNLRGLILGKPRKRCNENLLQCRSAGQPEPPMAAYHRLPWRPSSAIVVSACGSTITARP